jgi:hypothetical protein
MPYGNSKWTSKWNRLDQQKSDGYLFHNLTLLANGVPSIEKEAPDQNRIPSEHACDEAARERHQHFHPERRSFETVLLHGR